MTVRFHPTQVIHPLPLPLTHNLHHNNRHKLHGNYLTYQSIILSMACMELLVCIVIFIRKIKTNSPEPNRSFLIFKLISTKCTVSKTGDILSLVKASQIEQKSMILKDSTLRSSARMEVYFCAFTRFDLFYFSSPVIPRPILTAS